MQLFPNFPKNPQIMAILNVTPDSFSDGGLFNSVEAALEQAKRCEREGADFLDIGAESTRPGHDPVSAEEERARLLPVLARLKGEITLPISVDTYKASVADAALKAGASFVNDVWGLQREPEIAAVSAKHGAPVIIMHNRFEGADPKIDIWDDMERWFDRSLAIARQNDIPDDKIILDPGIGFGKTLEQNLIVLAKLQRLQERGFKTLMGLSRKRFLGAILDADVGERLIGTVTANIWSVLSGIDMVRVHDVKEHRQALKVMTAIHTLSV